jgi:hypothetical protein
MSRIALRVALSSAFVAATAVPPAGAQAEAKKTNGRPAIERKLPETQGKRDVFSGNEVRIAHMNNVNADCSSGSVPDVRVITKPANGDIRLEPLRTVIDRRGEDRRMHCNGKEVEGLGLFYKSRDGFVGQDKVTVDVDYKNGTVKRFVYSIAVR